jgi:hypothetical protein
MLCRRELLDELEKLADEKTRRRRDSPATSRALSGVLRRLAPNLRQAGASLTFGREGKRRTRVVRLERSCARPSAPSATPRPAGNCEDAGGRGGRSADGGAGQADGRAAPDRPPNSPKTAGKATPIGMADAADGRQPRRSDSDTDDSELL